MPLYEYRCAKCGARFEKIRKFSDPPLTKCEKCGGKLERLLSSPAFKFKGTGWYVNDYGRKDSGGAAEKNDSAVPGKKESTPSDKADKPTTSKSGETKEAASGSKTKDSKHRSGK
ncbi:MAG TPA: zinc ribbon domain-containing protein [Terriglobia bacterium]|nr:zinc ribbon domain-containing protein [Terriglobia bacterium]